MAHPECTPDVHGRERYESGHCKTCKRLHDRDRGRAVPKISIPHPFEGRRHCRNCRTRAHHKNPAYRRHVTKLKEQRRRFVPPDEHPNGYVSGWHCRDCRNEYRRGYLQRCREGNQLRQMISDQILHGKAINTALDMETTR